MDKSQERARIDADDDPGANSGERDLVALGIVTAAIILFVGTGSSIGPDVVRSFMGQGKGPDGALLNAFLLNIALIIFGWSRYRELAKEVKLRRKAERQARILAETDPLTGFLNRRAFDAAVNGMIADARQRNEAVAVLLMDLDNFKQVNDYNGHSAGDQLLLECSRRIAAILPARALVSRIGGDEFAAAMPFEKHRPERVEQLVGRLVDAISTPAQVNATDIGVTASIGIARSDLAPIGDQVRDQASDLLEMADIAMYHAKRQGRNRFYWFEADMADEMRFRSEIEAGIRRGLARGEFVPYYEQQIDLQTGELTGFEMLARWDSPDFGVVSPEIFIPIAEDIGVIGQLSESVIRQALADAKTWDPRLTLAVNISPVQLRDSWFSQKLLKLLVEANFPPHRLEIEVTESSLHRNIAQVRSLITSLKNQGIRVSLDDFGTGYSSLAQLRTLPFDRIKIDRSFVTSLVENRDSAAIVHAIAMLGKGLNLPVTAEGIESSEVLEQLRQYGDIKGQGYLYGKPATAEDTRLWLQSLGLLLVTEAMAAIPHEQTPQTAAAPPRLTRNG
ncbi:putative bifunctional diguanylate cyclase/phosphodiesterase [Novosphingobium album (ex Liu et al. 2023)]|uniref:EAL domain-containing protein n=1 Tax=Novosphingobium album (ex Liu et al. 2023) TaxID=3031130 RepID=A0ABT5WSS1_9SPHN|nr:EAL domain-containing protein [Novosphingobium album (ex Liu et al. 2023)]MDE8652048.1 EAL domain-containing protein [Novosphingobium album (ex Liu et al. 2023)]